MRLLSMLFLISIPFISYTQTIDEFCSQKEKEVFPSLIIQKIKNEGVDVESKAMVVRFGKKGCIPCKAEMPLFIQAAELNRHVIFVYFSEDGEDILPYEEIEFGNLFFLHLDYDSVVDLKLMFGYPTTYWVGSDRSIIKVTVGGIAEKNMLPKVREHWQKLINLLE